MIEEAKMLAESPGQSMENLNNHFEDKTPVREIERSRSRKSESVVSVIELPPAPVMEEEEPMPMSRRGVPIKRSPTQQQALQPLDTVAYQGQEEPEQLPPPPLEEMQAPPVHVSRSRGSSKTTPQPPGGRKVVNREPSVGSDRYEEIIVETRKRSQSRSRMGSRTSSVMDFKSSNMSLGRHDFDSLRGNNKGVAALDLDTKNEASKIVAAKQVESPVVPKRQVEPPAPPKQPELTSLPVRNDKSQLMALDGNGNATTPSLPTVPPRPVTPDPLVKLFPKNIPDWFMITYTYSVVLILILLIANITPDGKLYIHFTAFWSLIIYFVLEDEQVIL